MTARGTVINVHGHGATVRLDDGKLAAVLPNEVAAHRAAYLAGLQKREPLEFALEQTGRHRIVFLTKDRAAPATPPLSTDESEGADGEVVRTLRLVEEGPVLNDPLFEHRIATYLKSTEAWAPADRPAPDERNRLRKKKRAAFFEARTTKRPPPI